MSTKSLDQVSLALLTFVCVGNSVNATLASSSAPTRSPKADLTSLRLKKASLTVQRCSSRPSRVAVSWDCNVSRPALPRVVPLIIA